MRVWLDVKPNEWRTLNCEQYNQIHHQTAVYCYAYWHKSYLRFSLWFNSMNHISNLAGFFYSTKWSCSNKNDSLKIPLEMNLCKIKYFLTAAFISIRLCLTMNLCSCKLVEYKIEKWMSGKSTFFTDPEGIYENELNVIFCLLITLTSSWWTKFCWTSRLGSIQ